jgi:anti-sigma factor RsiW
MTDHDKALRLQAWLDGELPEAEGRAMTQWAEGDPDARRLCAELRAVRDLLQGQELERKLPESREFYWSKISCAIEGAQAHPRTRRSAFLTSWWRLALPVGAALVLLGALVWKTVLRPGVDSLYLATDHEIETPLEEGTSFTFRSESARMTVVWVNNLQIN